ncbi:MAG: hypothetical protein MJY62_00785, partial [Bacteroidales bacterium]|nr:hypothetical protein [Bacteroidales bacterium]
NVEGSNHNGKERSPGRTPMQWDSSSNCGFSECAPENIYLPVCPEWTPANSYQQYLQWKSDGCPNPTSKGLITVESQNDDPESLLNWTRKLIALRKSSPAFHAGSFWKPVYPESGAYPMVYRRYCDNENYLVALNPTAKTIKTSIPHQDCGNIQIVMSEGNVNYKAGKARDTLTMSGTSVIIIKLK